MAEHIEREKVYEMLNALGGCGAEPESWADGWDKAIDTAIYELNKIPAADVRPERHGNSGEMESKIINSLDALTTALVNATSVLTSNYEELGTSFDERIQFVIWKILRNLQKATYNDGRKGW